MLQLKKNKHFYLCCFLPAKNTAHFLQWPRGGILNPTHLFSYEDLKIGIQVEAGLVGVGERLQVDLPRWGLKKKNKIGIKQPYDPGIPLLCIYLRKPQLKKIHVPQCSLQTIYNSKDMKAT